MRALTLHQPWASLVALGVKTMLDTSWPCPPSLIGQPLAIHAGLTKADWRDPVWAPLIEPGTACILRVGLRPLPLGAVVATCRVAACVPIVNDGAARNCVDVRPWEPGLRFSALRLDDPDGGERITIVSDQLPYGVFSPGRYAWLLEDVAATTERCPACWGEGRFLSGFTIDGRIYDPCSTCAGAGHCPPVPARGRQRVWNWEPT